MADLAVINGTVVNPFVGPRPATVVVKGGQIADVVPPDEPVVAARIIDAQDLLVLPGAIDAHFHCRAPAFPARGDFASETRAAAAGGVTTIFEMPISKPGVATAAVWNARCQLAARDAFVNVGLFGAPGLGDAVEIAAMAASGAIAFKLFLTRAPAGREDEFIGLQAENLGAVAEALSFIRPTGLRCAFHAEDQSLVDFYSARAIASDKPDYRRHLMSRPSVTEATAVAALVTLAHALDTPIHIVHVTSRSAVEAIRHARAQGAPVTAETCPHYLLFTDDILAEVGPFGKINPPLRTADDCDALWEGLADGTLDFIATDHAPFTLAEKEAAWDDIMNAPPGHPGVEALVPIVLTEALRDRFSLARAVELISTGPAQVYDLYPRKGIVKPGSDADLCLYDPRPETHLDRADWLTRAAQCNRLYDGRPVHGQVHSTIVGGKLVYDAGVIRGQPGDGQIVRPGTPKQYRAPDSQGRPQHTSAT